MLISSKFPLTVFDVKIDVIALPLTVDTLRTLFSEAAFEISL